MNQYTCKYCEDIQHRDSTKQWITSYCSKSGRNVRLQLKKDMVPAIEQHLDETVQKEKLSTDLDWYPADRYRGAYAKSKDLLVGSFKVRENRVEVWLALIDKYYTVSKATAAIKLINIQYSIFKLRTMFTKLNKLIN
jgi:hypothetical protein